MAEKVRLDTLLVEQGFETSRERAKATIMSGIVFVNNQKADKAGELYTREDKIEVRGKTLQYVSRGGLKLEKALSWFQVDPVPPPVALPMCCSKTERKKFIQWMLVMASWPGACAMIPGWFVWSVPISAM